MEQLIRQRYTMNDQPRDTLSAATAKVKTKFRHPVRESIIRLPDKNNLAIDDQYEEHFDGSEGVQENSIANRDAEEQPFIDNDTDVELHTISNVDDENFNNNIHFNNNNINNNYIRPASIILNAQTESKSPTIQNKRSPQSSNNINQIGSKDRLTPLNEPDDYLVTGRILSTKQKQHSNQTSTNRETVLPAPISRSAIINNRQLSLNNEFDNPQLRNAWLIDDKYKHQSLPNISSVGIETTTFDNRQKQYYYERAHEQQQQLVFIAFGLAIFLLIALAVYNWFHKRRRDEILSSTKGGDLFDSLPLFPSNCGKACAGGNNKIPDKRTRTSESNVDFDNGEEMHGFVGGQAENHGCGAKNKSKGLQLVGRVLPNKNAASELEKDGVIICEETRLDQEEEGERDEITIQQRDRPSKENNNRTVQEDDNENDEKKLPTMVTLKRKIVNHPLIINARSTAKPRVKLIKASVRKFIDDEAADMRDRKRELTLRQTLENKMKNFFSVALNGGRKSSNTSGRTVLNEKLDKEIDLEEVNELYKQVEEEQQQQLEMNNLESFLKPVPQQQEQVLSVEVHATTNGIENEQICDKSDHSGVLQRELSNNCLLPNQNNRKLSPFSVDGLNDAYSSLSACSLFSSSPVEAQRSAQNDTCACSYTNSYGFSHNTRSALAALPFGKGLDPAGTIKNDTDMLRCKSQGHSPFLPAQATYNRPCCSASPLTVSQAVGKSQQVSGTASCCRLPSSYHDHHQIDNQVARNAQLHLQHHEQVSKRLHNMPTNHHHHHQHLTSDIQSSQNYSTRKPNVSDCEQSCNNLMLNNSARHTSTMPQYPSLNGNNKCINRIQRQYENYYDDEQEDAYRRLTASIGMEFGLGFSDDPPPPPPHHHHVPIETATASPTASYNYNIQTNVDNRSFNHFGVDRYSCYNRSRLDSGLASYVNFQTQFIENSQGCKCCIDKDSFQGKMNIQQPLQHHQQYPQQFVPSQQFDNSCQYLFRSNGGSAGELLSSTSTSTSFGGSDSGFAATTATIPSSNSRQVCRNPGCICQSNAMTAFAPQVPMSILVHQPSMGTPPPPLSQPATITEQPLTKETADLDELITPSLSKQDEESCSINGGKENTRTEVGPLDEIVQDQLPAKATSAKPKIDELSDVTVGKKSQQSLLKNTSQQCCKPGPRWRYRRRYSQKARSDMIGELSQLNSPSIRTPRRMSIAGDHVTQSTFCESANQAILHRDALLNRDDVSCGISLANEMGPSLQHRSSIVSEGGWNPSGSNQPTKPIQQLQKQTQREAFYNQFKTFWPPYNQHRPSEPSLFDNHHPFGCIAGGGLNGKSNCSSSGGSSSGIGASGSTCTNTPTSAFPNSSFTATPAKVGTEFFADFPVLNQQGQDKVQSTTAYNYQLQNFLLLQQQQQQQQYQQLFQQHNNQCSHFREKMCYDVRATNMWPPSRYSHQSEIGTCPSRKFSLPVQLESQVAETVSPNNARLLFKENLQRDDSANVSLSSSTQNQAKILMNESISGRQVLSHLDSPTCGPSNSSSNSNRANGLNRIFDRRMSSQTITRQSSFWVEDNSADSILSLATISGGLNEVDGSQVDINQSWCLQDQGEKAGQQFDSTILSNPTSDMAQKILEDHDIQHPKGSNHPSISSLILSADSIESVKQKSSVAAQEDPEISLEFGGKQRDDNSDASNNSNNNANCNDNNNNKSIENSQTSNKEWSSSNSTISTGKEKKLKSSFAHMRNRLSSSTSTSSTTSSPSPDFSKPSERILGLASKSSSISKRHMFGKLRSRRYPRLVNSTGGGESSSSCRHPVFALHQHSAPDARLKKNESSSQEKEDCLTKNESPTVGSEKDIDTNSVIDKSSQSCSQDNNDPDAEGLITERPMSDMNSASLERQCRELWKLRAALYDDSCAGDDWTNYHQRLNRRYDSGYKSIENQLSSSLEGNIMAAATATVNPQAAGNVSLPPSSTTTGVSQHRDRSFNRPRSGCSNYIDKTTTKTTPTETQNLNAVDVVTDDDDLLLSSSKTSGTPTRDPVLLTQTDESPYKILEAKLSDLELDGALECLLDEPGRECNSQSSKSSSCGEEEKKTGCDTNQ